MKNVFVSFLCEKEKLKFQFSCPPTTKMRWGKPQNLCEVFFFFFFVLFLYFVCNMKCIFNEWNDSYTPLYHPVIFNEHQRALTLATMRRIQRTILNIFLSFKLNLLWSKKKTNFFSLTVYWKLCQQRLKIKIIILYQNRTVSL